MIRPYAPSDRQALLEIFKRNTPEYFDPAEINDFTKYLDEFSDTYLTIEHQNKIAGGTGYYISHDDRSGHISWIFIHPDFKGLGLGREAVENCLAILKSNPNVERLGVATSQLTYRFFERFGFVLVRTENDYWGPGLHLYLMQQFLTK